jgi:DNA-binding transcriptional LysR family regulator
LEYACFTERPAACLLLRKARGTTYEAATSLPPSRRPKQKHPRQVGGRRAVFVSIACLPAFAFNQLIPTFSDFLSRYPEIELELALTDRVVDLLQENADVAIRVGAVNDPSLVARRFGEIRRGLFASPEYLARCGTPQTPEALSDHDCIVVKSLPSALRWPFYQRGEMRNIDVKCRVLVESGEAALQLAIAGCGITRLADLIAAPALRDGRLKPILSECHATELAPLSAAYPHGRIHMPKVRVFVDYLLERFGHVPWRLSSAKTHAAT